MLYAGHTLQVFDIVETIVLVGTGVATFFEAGKVFPVTNRFAITR